MIYIIHCTPMLSIRCNVKADDEYRSAELTGQYFQVAGKWDSTSTTTPDTTVLADVAAQAQGGNAVRDSTAQVVSYPDVADDNDGVMVSEAQSVSYPDVGVDNNGVMASEAQTVNYPDVGDDVEYTGPGGKGKGRAMEKEADDHTTEDQLAEHQGGGASTLRRVSSKAGEAAERRRGDRSGSGAPEEQAAATDEAAYTTLPREFLMDDFGDTNVNVGAEEDATLRDTAWITHIINEGQYHRLIIQVRGIGGA